MILPGQALRVVIATKPVDCKRFLGPTGYQFDVWKFQGSRASSLL